MKPSSAKVLASVVTILLSMVPPMMGSGCATTAMARGSTSGMCTMPCSTPEGAGMENLCRPIRLVCSSDLQALYYLAVFEVRLDDLVDVALIDIGVPDRLRLNRHHRTVVAAVHAAGRVDADAVFLGGDARRLDFVLGV